MIKKILLSLVILSTAILSLITLCTPVSATKPAEKDEDSNKNGTSAVGFHGDCRDFAGFTSWDCNVDITSAETIKTGVWTIAANVLTDISVLAAYLVLGYVIYGGYLYIMSSGDPGKIADGKKTLIHAFIGLAIVMLSNVILNTIRIALGTNFSADCTTTNCGDPGVMATNAIQWVIGMAGIVAVIFIVYGGVGYMTSNGDPGKVKKSRDAIVYAGIGLIIVAIAEIITAFVTNTIKDAAINTTYQTIISKEVHDIKID